MNPSPLYLIIRSSFYLFVLAFFITGCSYEVDCPDPERSTVTVSSSHTGQLPYTGMDTIILLSNELDTITCVGNGKYTFYIDETTQYNGGDCLITKIVSWGGYKILFTGTSCLLSERYSLSRSEGSQFTIDYKGYKDTFDFSFLGARYMSNPPYLDSFRLGAKYYYGVNVFSNGQDSLYLNQTEGFLYLKTPDYSLTAL